MLMIAVANCYNLWTNEQSYEKGYHAGVTQGLKDGIYSGRLIEACSLWSDMYVEAGGSEVEAKSTCDNVVKALRSVSY